LWDMTPFGSCKNRRFGRTHRLRCSQLADSMHPDDGGDTFLRNVVSYKNHTASHPRRHVFLCHVACIFRGEVTPLRGASPLPLLSSATVPVGLSLPRASCSDKVSPSTDQVGLFVYITQKGLKAHLPPSPSGLCSPASLW
jgi:hypothetical protein